MLRRARRGTLPADELRAALADAYTAQDPDSVTRRFHEDLDGLRAAGLVDYTDLRASRPVRLIAPEKDPSLRFTHAEHRALLAAREQVGWSPRAVEPVEEGASKLAALLRVIRCVEELGDADVAEIATCAGMRESKVRTLVPRLRAGASALECLAELEVDEDAIDRAGGAAPSRLRLAPGPDRSSPLLGVGMDEFGLFAYGPAEVADRLALIEAALAAGFDDALLLRARAKLELWSERLARAGRARRPDQGRADGGVCGCARRQVTAAIRPPRQSRGSPPEASVRRRPRRSAPPIGLG